MESSSRSRGIALLLAALVGLALVPGVAVADQRVGGTVVIEAGQTVDSLEVVAGSVVVRGTVDGDLNGAAGDILIASGGTVTGSVNAAVGALTIRGDVGGDVSTGAGSVRLAETGTVGGDFDVGAGDVVVAGTVRGDAVIGADTIRLADTAVVEGNVRYDGRLTDEGAAVGGTLARDESIGRGPGVGVLVPSFGLLGAVYATLANLLLGAVLLVVLPAFTREVTDRALDAPARSGLWGLLALVGVPVVLVLVAITIVGIPLSIVGLVLYLVALWTGAVYGRLAVGAWVVDRLDVDSRWAGLVVGVVGIGVLAAVPYVGWLVELAVLLVGLGALAAAIVDRRRSDRAAPEMADGDGDRSPA